MTAEEALGEILDDIICATHDDAAEVIDELEKRGFRIVAFKKQERSEFAYRED